jgi:hypothetical protein
MKALTGAKVSQYQRLIELLELIWCHQLAPCTYLLAALENNLETYPLQIRLAQNPDEQDRSH